MSRFFAEPPIGLFVKSRVPFEAAIIEQDHRVRKESEQMENGKLSTSVHPLVMPAEFMMPILSRSRLSGLPQSVPIPVECESQAKQNCCGQTFARLAERGGLSPDEIIAIMEWREWRPMTVVEIVDAFRKYSWI